MVVRDAGCTLRLFQPPHSESRGATIGCGLPSVWRRPSRKHTADRGRASTDAAVAGDVGDASDVDGRVLAEAALRLGCDCFWEGPSSTAVPAGRRYRLSARWAAVKSDGLLDSEPCKQHAECKQSTETEPTCGELAVKTSKMPTTHWGLLDAPPSAALSTALRRPCISTFSV